MQIPRAWSRAFRRARAGSSTTLIVISLLGLTAVVLRAQQSPTDVLLQSEVASIKPNNSGNEVGRIFASNGWFRADNVNAETLIWMAYGNGRRLVRDLMKGGPDWIRSDR